MHNYGAVLMVLPPLLDHHFHTFLAFISGTRQCWRHCPSLTCAPPPTVSRSGELTMKSKRLNAHVCYSTSQRQNARKRARDDTVKACVCYAPDATTRAQHTDVITSCLLRHVHCEGWSSAARALCSPVHRCHHPNNGRHYFELSRAAKKSIARNQSA